MINIKEIKETLEKSENQPFETNNQEEESDEEHD